MLALLVTHAYEEREVTLSSGQKSDFYIDCKKVMLRGEGHFLLGALFFELMTRIEAEFQVTFAACGGMSIGADPLCSALSLTAFQKGRELPALYVRKEAKSHGSHRRVEGTEAAKKGSPIFVLEDVVTTGGSTLRAVVALREAGYKAAHVAAIVDRDAGGVAALCAEDLTLHTLFMPGDLKAPEA